MIKLIFVVALTVPALGSACDLEKRLDVMNMESNRLLEEKVISQEAFDNMWDLVLKIAESYATMVSYDDEALTAASTSWACTAYNTTLQAMRMIETHYLIENQI